jgi:hypothetical protein
VAGEITQVIGWGYRTASQYTTGGLARKVGEVINALTWRTGSLRKVGTLRLAGTPQVPAARRVVLMELDTLRVVRGTMSDAAGNYAFEKIDQYPGQYLILGIDQTGVYNADVADRITADPYP